MRTTLGAFVAALLLAGCGSADPLDDTLADLENPPDTTPVAPADPEAPLGRGTGLGPLSAEAIQAALLREIDLPDGLRATTDFDEELPESGVECFDLTLLMSGQLDEGAAASRWTGFTAGNLGPGLSEGIAGYDDGGAERRMTGVRDLVTACARHVAGDGETQTTYVVTPYSFAEVGDELVGIEINGSYTDVQGYIRHRIVAVRLGANVVTVATFGVLGNGISDDELESVVRRAVQRVVG